MVNINNFESDKQPDDILEMIFDKQAELMLKYGTKAVGEDIDTLKGSQEIRKFSKYTVEELAEAYQAYEEHSVMGDHVLEEMIDSLHFFIEKLLISNLSYKKILGFLKVNSEELRKIIEAKEEEICNYSLEGKFRLATYYSNIADNRLRNKEWKGEQLPTNRTLFYRESINGFLYYLAAFYSLGLNQEKLRDLYSRKNKVNHFRIKSNY